MTQQNSKESEENVIIQSKMSKLGISLTSNWSSDTNTHTHINTKPIVIATTPEIKTKWYYVEQRLRQHVTYACSYAMAKKKELQEQFTFISKAPHTRVDEIKLLDILNLKQQTMRRERKNKSWWKNKQTIKRKPIKICRDSKL